MRPPLLPRSVRVPLLPRPVRLAGAVLVAGVILYASVERPAEVTRRLGPLGIVGLDEWLHAIAYGTLAVAVAYALPAHSRRRLVVAVLVAVAFGLLVETIQFGLPYRSFDPVDAGVNALGALLATGTWRLLGFGRRLEPVAGATAPPRPPS